MYIQVSVGIEILKGVFEVYNLILDARKLSVDLRFKQNELSTYGNDTNDLIRDSANMIDRLTAAMMLAEATIESLTKALNLSKEDTDKMLGIIDSADGKMVDSYIKAHLVGVPAGNDPITREEQIEKHNKYVKVRLNSERLKLADEGLIIPLECYKEFGSDLDGCSRQENQGCKGCRCLIKK